MENKARAGRRWRRAPPPGVTRRLRRAVTRAPRAAAVSPPAPRLIFFSPPPRPFTSEGAPPCQLWVSELSHSTATAAPPSHPAPGGGSARDDVAGRSPGAGGRRGRSRSTPGALSGPVPPRAPLAPSGTISTGIPRHLNPHPLTRRKGTPAAKRNPSQRKACGRRRRRGASRAVLSGFPRRRRRGAGRSGAALPLSRVSLGAPPRGPRGPRGAGGGAGGRSPDHHIRGA